MYTVAELIAYLNTMPQEAIVEVCVEENASWGTYTSRLPVDLEECELVDFRNDPWVRENHVAFGKVYVHLNGRD
jgi:hypothetical protein